MTAYYNEFDPFAAEWLRNLIAGGGADLNWDALATGWPTTNATDTTGAGRSGRDGGANLQTAAAESADPTPDGLQFLIASRGGILTRYSAATANGVQLNPEHSRWLMRFPVQWALCCPGYAEYATWQALMATAYERPNAIEPAR